MNTKDVLSAVSSHLSNASSASAEPPKPTPMEQVLREVGVILAARPRSRRRQRLTPQ